VTESPAFQNHPFFYSKHTVSFKCQYTPFQQPSPLRILSSCSRRKKQLTKPNHKKRRNSSPRFRKPKKEKKNLAIISFSPLTVLLSLSLSLRPKIQQAFSRL
jgi:hypothetical protein